MKKNYENKPAIQAMAADPVRIPIAIGLGSPNKVSSI